MTNFVKTKKEKEGVVTFSLVTGSTKPNKFLDIHLKLEFARTQLCAAHITTHSAHLVQEPEHIWYQRLLLHF